MISISRSQRIDWPRMTDHLRRLGMTRAQIAAALDITPNALCNWAWVEDGAEGDPTGEPAFWTGAAMLVLWSERTGLQWTDAPTRTVHPSVARILREHA